MTQTTQINWMDIKEFRQAGFLQEVNRLFFHPRGLALAVTVNEETGEETLEGLWDYRDDPEGVYFGDDYMAADEAHHKSILVDAQRRAHLPVREKMGFMGGIQPIPLQEP